MTDRYALFGSPVANSLSPLIHKLFAEISGEDMVYTAYEVDANPNRFTKAANDFFNNKGGKGLNITVPCKFAACDYAWSRNPDIEPHYLVPLSQEDVINESTLELEIPKIGCTINSANVLYLEEGQLQLAMTDGIGLVDDLYRWFGSCGQRFPKAGSRILVLGAGGAATAVLPALGMASSVSRDDYADEITVVSRSIERAQKCCDLATESIVKPGSHNPYKATDYNNLSSQYDLIINATSLGHQGLCPPLPDGILSSQGSCYDMNYGAAADAFAKRAGQLGATAERFRDGLGMLLGQALYSFALWRGHNAADRVARQLQKVMDELSEAATPQRHPR